MKVAIYTRASSKKQDDKDISIPAQISEIKKYAEAKGTSD